MTSSFVAGDNLVTGTNWRETVAGTYDGSTSISGGQVTVQDHSGLSQGMQDMDMTEGDNSNGTQRMGNTDDTTHIHTGTPHAPPGLTATTTAQAPHTGAGTTPPTLHNSNGVADRWREEIQQLLEQDMLEDMDIIQARRSISPHLPHPTVESLYTATCTDVHERIKAYLEGLAYQIHHHSPFQVIGFSELDGPAPTTERVEHRRRLAARVTTHFAQPADNPEVLRTMEAINQACNTCIRRIPDIITQRKAIKGTTKNTPNWWELSPASIQFLADLHPLGPGIPFRVATQLSNLYKYNHNDSVARVDDARTLYTQLNSPPANISAALADLTQPVITWAPESPEQALKVAASFREVRARGLGPAALSMVVPFDHIPSCSTVTHITDVWSHPLLTPKAKDIVASVSIIDPPQRMIVSGPHAPHHTQKCLAVFTLQPCTAPAIPRLLRWQDTLLTQNSTQVIWIDCPHEYRWQIYHLIPTFELPGCYHTDRPRPSRSSTSNTPWANIKIHFNEGVGSTLMQDTITHWLKKTLSQYRAVVGLQTAITSPTSKILEITSPLATYHLGHLSHSCILLSNRMAVVDTLTSKEVWAERLTKLWEADPTVAAIRLRLRESDPSRSKKFAEVQATPEQISAARARKGHAQVEPDNSKPVTLRATLHIPLSIEGHVDTWAPQLMRNLSQLSGVQLKRHEGEQGLEWGTWNPILNFEGQWTGKILIQCQSKQDILQLHRQVCNKGVNIQGHCAAVEMSTEYFDLPAVA